MAYRAFAPSEYRPPGYAMVHFLMRLCFFRVISSAERKWPVERLCFRGKVVECFAVRADLSSVYVSVTLEPKALIPSHCLAWAMIFQGEKHLVNI